MPPRLGSRLTLVGGKGGVGKTTVAAALGVRLADEGGTPIVVSVDPAHSLGDALGVRLGPEPTSIPDLPALSALEVDPHRERRRFLESHRGALLSLLERGTYLDAADAAGLVDLTIPGLDELAALFRLQDLLAGDNYVIVDTAPTGHTLRLLELPGLARGWLGALQAMEDRSRAVSTALVGEYRPDEASALLGDLDRDLEGLSRLLRDPERTRFLLVTGREPVVLAETLRYQEELERRGIPIGGVVVNRSRAGEVPPTEDGQMSFVPGMAPEPVGAAALRRVAAHLFAEEAPAAVEAPPGGVTRLRLGEPFVPPADRVLYLVSGKGGVGKSTVAAALAVRLREEGRRVLLLSVDPAGSLGEILNAPVDAEARPVAGAEGLWARQLDAVSAWEEFRSDYQAEAESIFAGLLGGSGSDGSDRAVVERLVDLAPPGIDELAALMEVVDVTEDRPYDAVVLDTAPTGHFLRLLELPEVALQWTHQVMRLLLKYREVLAPGELAERLLKLARSLRQFDERLRDAAHTWVVAVALPEALGVPETERLLSRLRALGIDPGSVLLNRLAIGDSVGDGREAAAAALARAAGQVAAIAAPALESGPRGVTELAEFARRWRRIELEEE